VSARRRPKNVTPLDPAPPDLAEALRRRPLPDAPAGGDFLGFAFDGDEASERDATAVEIAECSFSGVDLSGAALRRASVRDSRVEGGSWANVEATEATIRRVEMRGVRLTGATFVRARLEDVVFVGCRMDFTSLRFAELERVRFEECRLEEADLYRVRASNVAFASCALVRASIAEATFERCEMRECDLTALGNAERLRNVAMPWTDVLRNAATLAEGLGVAIVDDADA
jgi:uncharacterized protein YjbI with pentapeptide repeats